MSVFSVHSFQSQGEIDRDRVRDREISVCSLNVCSDWGYAGSSQEPGTPFGGARGGSVT